MSRPYTLLSRAVVKVLNRFPFALHKDFHLGHNIASLYKDIFLCALYPQTTHAQCWNYGAKNACVARYANLTKTQIQPAQKKLSEA